MSTRCFKARPARRGVRAMLGGLAIVVAAGACGSSSHHALPPASSTSTTRTVPAATTTTTTLPELQTTGPRTVLSPLGLNVRADPATSAKVLGTASQGVVLTVLGHIASGWFKVKGATVTGYITDSSRLSAPGKFLGYARTVDQFALLYPATWKAAVTPVGVAFRPPASSDSIVVTTAPTVAKLPPGRVGYTSKSSTQVVVCGVTSQLAVYGKATATVPTVVGGVTSRPYLAQVRLTLDAQHALAVNANITSLTQLQTVDNFIYSVTFPFPECEQ